jgi:peroxiredoxin|tara:strand:- start:243 stop:845 length:603 start_codon:yes stop_codon:yes gene_type:complete
LTFKKFPQFTLFFIILALLTFVKSEWCYASQKGDQAPGFTLKSLSGPKVALEDFKGRYVLVNFWATWCVPCKIEMPSLEELHRKFPSNKLAVLPISNDMFGEKVVRPYIKSNDFSFTVLFDPTLKVSNRYGVVTLPTTFLIDPDGKIIGVLEGAEDWSKPETIIYFEDLLKKVNPSTTSTKPERKPINTQSEALNLSIDG